VTAARARVETWASLAPVGGSRYQVSDMGRVRNSSGHIMALTVSKGGKGYPRVKLVCDDGRKRWFDVHVSMMAAHVGPRPPGMDVCHGKLGKVNLLENLRYDTRAANLRDRWGRWRRWSRTVRAVRRAWSGSR
jgi:NUMOD4 motif